MEYSCRVCGHGLMSSIGCKLHGGPICPAHCEPCPYFDPGSWHCSYYQKEIAPAVIAAEIEAAKQKRIDEAAAKEQAIIEKHSAMIREWQARHRTK